MKDIDFEYRQIVVRDGKGGRDRVTPLPSSLTESLNHQVDAVAEQHRSDLQAGYGAVYLPTVLARKYANAEMELAWQYLFPSRRLSKDPRSGVTRRHHLSEKGLQQAVKEAVRRVTF